MPVAAPTDKSEPKLYELGYLCSPLRPAEEVAGQITAVLKKPINELSGLITGELEPRLIKLAYPVGRSVEHKRTVFKEAYFGAIRFSLPAEFVSKLESRWKLESELLRFLIVVLPKGAAQAPVLKRRPARRRPLGEGESPTSRPAGKIKPAMSNEDIDKEIEGLLAEQKV